MRLLLSPRAFCLRRMFQYMDVRADRLLEVSLTDRIAELAAASSMQLQLPQAMTYLGACHEADVPSARQ